MGRFAVRAMLPERRLSSLLLAMVNCCGIYNVHTAHGTSSIPLLFENASCQISLPTSQGGREVSFETNFDCVRRFEPGYLRAVTFNRVGDDGSTDLDIHRTFILEVSFKQKKKAS